MSQPDKLRERRPSSSKGNRLTQFFSSSPKSKEHTQQALLAMQQHHQNQLHATSPSSGVSTSSVSLPAISLSAAAPGDQTSIDGATTTTTLFEPKTAEEVERQKRADAQFGPLCHPSHLYTSKSHGRPLAAPIEDEPHYGQIITTYISYLILILLGHIRDFFGKRFGDKKHYNTLKVQNGYAPLNDDFDSFYSRRLKRRLDDCFARTTTGVPGRFITLLDRKSADFNRSYEYTGTTTETLNMSSYNYLGFAQSEGPCADAVEECVRRCGVTTCSPRSDAGTTDLSLEVEREIASFVGKPASMVFSMGYVTNASSFPAIVSKGCLVISDELNHASIRVGTRLSGAVIKIFKHNNVKDLERVLREAMSQGQPRTHRPWKKILVVVEGLYSMEGTMCDLPRILALKRKYKFYLFLDEAHSIGALGPRGRGVCDYFGIDPAEVDILMGTLTKSFGANGGYIAADQHIIDKLRSTNAATLLGETPSPCVLMQILASLKMITGELCPGQGEERLRRIAFNSRYLRLGLKRLGYIVSGHDDSPIIPVLLYHPAKIPAFSHEMLRRKISVVVVGYPATPLIESRARFCVSSAHNKDDLDRLLLACDEVADAMNLKYSSGVAGGLEPLPADVEVAPEEEWQYRKDHGIPTKKPRWAVDDVIRVGVRDAKLPLR
ncbi:Serine palmitoyltransferase-like protein [Hapsidospora chrysogenum ATCC 11550]|uniref:Serine palmitoyltransferase-like protein n=1 Tax=Hapsidospora chrysogenum (strain ATCC 11550 / CBS 779.69 / DSM 880 / IAM 14645 / JCM 23072 / IMI 49137) TaxID=857340 RepID=A0A086T3K9_HAPC1|nr:Serine palmitoyltransferase-like protein [Hapsidospora chrysogenum ATCC 11550]